MRIFNSETKSGVTDEDRERHLPEVKAALIETRKDYQGKALLNDIQERKSNVLAEEFISD